MRLRITQVQTPATRQGLGIDEAYYDFVDRDPAKVYVQFPWAMRQLAAGPQGKRVLDVGCGEGALSRMLAREGASVCGYDPSVSAIHLARAAELEAPLGVEYSVAYPRDVHRELSPKVFDAALAIATLHYADSNEELRSFFSSTLRLLRPGGVFAALVTNPHYKRWGVQAYNRRYSIEPGQVLRAEFFEEGELQCSARYTAFSAADYETAAAQTGWPPLEWVPVRVSEAGRRALGGFWDGFDEDCPYAGFRASKPSAVDPSA